MAAQALAVVGLLVGADVWARLHFIGPGSIVAPAVLALAIVIEEGVLSQAGLKSLLVAGLLLASNPILVHATARAAYVRERGSLALPTDVEETRG